MYVHEEIENFKTLEHESGIYMVYARNPYFDTIFNVILCDGIYILKDSECEKKKYSKLFTKKSNIQFIESIEVVGEKDA